MSDLPLATRYQVGDDFMVQFVWHLPNGDFLRALFQVHLLSIDWSKERHTLQINQWVGGRQESRPGELSAQLSKEYWALAKGLVGKKFMLPFEAEDGQPVRLKLSTLTGEHNYFNRLG